MNRKPGWIGWVTLVLFFAVSASVSAAGNGEKLFNKRCSQCHTLPSPDKLTSKEWVSRLNMMAPMAGLKKKQKSEVLNFLQSHSKKASTLVSMSREKKLFEDKCSLCHSPQRVFLRPLTAESRRHIVLRMQERASGWISPQEAERILAYLDQGAPGIKKPKRKKINGGTDTVFRERCTGCHSLERIYLELEEHKQLAGKSAGWMHIVKRMREKAPDWMTSKEAEKIVKYLSSLKPVMKNE
ncbi:MAG: hypothetical protein V3R65_04320 [Acidiferrobacterales bacterium]